MLFNSYLFVLAFLPLTLALFYLFGRYSRESALRWLIFASLVFYAWWRPFNLAIIVPSILVNYGLARALQRLGQKDNSERASRLTLIAGLTFNILLLGYFKYSTFLTGAMNDAFGTSFVLTQVILPLGISFITFQKIAFLIDVHGKRIDSFTFRDYSLFVLFFPQLIAGPIVHYREMMPQFQRARCRFDATDFAAGITMFAFGLFKKAVLADGIAPFVTMIYERAGSGQSISLLPALFAAVGFTLQIYFDFSGYSDMAIGLGRLFGVRLPANFESPLRSSSIIDYWLRWHITLSRFLTAYIYNPLLLALTRRRLARARSAGSRRGMGLGSFAMLVVFPTLVTMFISGLWHGAGYTFIVWGLLHGIFLSVNHGWRQIKSRYFPKTQQPLGKWRLPGFLLTFASIATAMVFFKAASLSAASKILAGMVGFHGIGLPNSIFEHLGPIASLLQKTGGGPESWWSATDLLWLCGWTLLLSVIAFLLPNTLQLLRRFEPALHTSDTATLNTGWLTQLQWRPTLRWAMFVAAIAVTGVLRLGGPSEFLYWQF
jgi:D-alanyl-lipoteichoic acid acyltransferase DltB (MBOAT superfamily)